MEGRDATAPDAGGRTLVELTRDECLALLATQSVGRVAVAQGLVGPLVVPVNYVVEGASIFFLSGYGAKLRAALFRPVSFQVDAIDPATHTGWSVLVRGRAEEVHRRHAGGSLPTPWATGEKPYLVRIPIRAISGRRLR